MDYSGDKLKGYEIHMGETVLTSPAESIFNITQRSEGKVNLQDGYINQEGTVFGTYCHGVFDNDELRRAFLNALRRKKVWPHYRYNLDIGNIKSLSLTV